MDKSKHNGLEALLMFLAQLYCLIFSILFSAIIPSQQVPAPVQADAWFDNYKFRSGETLDRLRIHYVTMGTPRRDTYGEIDNAVLVLHWTGASSQNLLAPEFRKALFNPGKPLDAGRYYLIFIDNVGHGQSSKPSDGLRAGFPNYGYKDIVDLQHNIVVDILGVKRLHAILGLSMGGMNAWQWAEAYPKAMDGVMPVVSFPTKVSGRNLLWRHIITDAIRNDPSWDNGNYTKPPLGWIQSYPVLQMMIDSVIHLQETIPDNAAVKQFMKESPKQAEQIDANDILYSLQSSADYDPEPFLSSIQTKLFALNFTDDEFNPEQLRVLERLVPKVKNGRYVVQPGTLKSRGHLTMTQPELWARHVAAFMEWLESGKGTDR
ncbi:alpha/beta fold hydrolase [Paenibacillus sp. NPDC058174]|uniref:alpha/beta fold hydrolase n=1 Tax=Paenibacillus sp. NPDC058174 TaxID=3346366 RepID=UPI0036DEA3B7